MTERIRVAVIGSGNIGTDLTERLVRDSDFEVVAVVGRRPESPGLLRFRDRVQYVLDGGVEALLPLANSLDGFFDATSAFDHLRHWKDLEVFGLWAVDLTPSRVGKPIVPQLVNRVDAMKLESQNSSNYSMVTCGGQSSAPLIYAIAKFAEDPTEVEVSSSIASRSAGPATRANIEQYVNTTENLVNLIVPDVAAKVILVLNPADPPVMMRTTVTVRASSFDLRSIVLEAQAFASEVRDYVPGYEIVLEPHFVNTGVLSATCKVTGAGYYLPEYSGNLDIINAAAVETARRHARGKS